MNLSQHARSRFLIVALIAALGLVLAVLAHGAEGEPDDVRETLAHDVVVNWTQLTLEVTARAHGRGVGSTTKAVEYAARRSIGPDARWGAARVRVDAAATVADLAEEPELSDPVRARMERWVVAEARYHASGRVELVGELSLLELLKPWSLQVAEIAPEPGRRTGYTGLVIDARGTEAVPAWSPRILHGDEVLFSGHPWDDVALFRAPVIYVPDPAHPAASRAGDRPLVVTARGAEGPDLYIDDIDLVRFRTALHGTRALGEGTVVVVVDR